MHARVISSRPLVYTDEPKPDEDRPPHVRAASAIAQRGDELFIVQDDAAFIARVRGNEVTAIPLPMRGGRRRFETALGNKLEKLDLESCVFLDDELWAFGSGSLPNRESIIRLRIGDDSVRVDEAHELYARLREAIGGPINIEGVSLVDDELWFWHRGNTSLEDRPAIVRADRAMQVRRVDRFDLGRIGGVALGFTDACGTIFIAAAEQTANAIDDGRVLGNAIGIVDGGDVRITPLVVAGKAEGITVSGFDHAWITVDPDDTDVPTTLYEVELVGIKQAK